MDEKEIIEILECNYGTYGKYLTSNRLKDIGINVAKAILDKIKEEENIGSLNKMKGEYVKEGTNLEFGDIEPVKEPTIQTIIDIHKLLI